MAEPGRAIMTATPILRTLLYSMETFDVLVLDELPSVYTRRHAQHCARRASRWRWSSCRNKLPWRFSFSMVHPTEENEENEIKSR